jgi:hypothetical protein
MYTGHEEILILYGSTADGWMEASYTAEYPIEDDTVADSKDITQTKLYVRVTVDPPMYPDEIYTLWRSCVYFDTSVLPAGTEIVQAILSLWVEDKGGSTSDNLYVDNGQPTYPHDPLELADFGDVHYDTEIATVAYDDITADEYLNIDIPAAAITPGGTTKLRLSGDNTISYRFIFTSADAASNKPQLLIAYIAAAVPPIPPKANIADVWVDPTTALMNIGDEWVVPEETKINIGDSWVDPQ